MRQIETGRELRAFEAIEIAELLSRRRRRFLKRSAQSARTSAISKNAYRKLIRNSNKSAMNKIITGITFYTRHKYVLRCVQDDETNTRSFIDKRLFV